jgi:hypothetical protein
MAQRPKPWLVNGLLLVGSLLVTLLLFEGLGGLILSYPWLVAAKDGSANHALNVLRQYYITNDRSIVQYEPDCFRYDPELTYTLKPESTCTVVNREHTVEYRANRQGVRDSESALDHPSIVVVGDSQAMGWGVAQSESFPKVLEQELRVSVLNAAISSYGTARELALLERLRLPEFPVLIIQYCDNDFLENMFLVDKGALEIMPEPKFRSFTEDEAKQRRYYPFKYTVELIEMERASWATLQPASAVSTDGEEARYFLEVLLRHRKLIEGKTVLVIELNSYNRNDGAFLAALADLLNKPAYATLKDSVVPLDLSKALTSADYYVLDDHMTRIGHAKVARLIAAELTRRAAFGQSRSHGSAPTR